MQREGTVRFLVLVLVAATLTGCVEQRGIPDVGQARIVNDTGRRVIIWRCSSNDCRTPDSFIARLLYAGYPSKFELNPGEGSAFVNISRRGVPNPFLVLRPTTSGQEPEEADPEKQRVGCLPFVMPHYIEGGLVARVSQVVPCRDSYDEDAVWPPGEARKR
jgi:hypothetical protein